jgi:hypothetical protein
VPSIRGIGLAAVPSSAASRVRRWTIAAVLAAATAFTAACSPSDPPADGDIPSIALKADTSSTVVVDRDAFARTVLLGWAKADAGGAWTVGGGPRSDFSVESRAATMHVHAPGVTLTAYLFGLVARHSISRVDVTFSKPFTGDGSGYISLAARHTNTSQYRLRIKVLSSGTVQISIVKTVAHTDTVLATRDTKVVFHAGQYLRMRLEVKGKSPVALEGRVWPVGSPEPTVPQVFVNDTKDPLLDGHAGLLVYLSAHATNAPVDASFANFLVSELIT